MESTKIDSIAKIEKIVETFEVSVALFPRGKVTFRIIEVGSACYSAIPNAAAKNQRDGTPEWIGGLGENVIEALVDAIQRFLLMIEEHKAYEEKDFEWSDFNDF